MDDASQEREPTEQEIPPLYSMLSKEEEIKALAMAIAVYEKRDLSDRSIDIVTALREVQRKIRWEQREERALEQEKLTQRSIQTYFSQNTLGRPSNQPGFHTLTLHIAPKLPANCKLAAACTLM